MLFLYWYVAAHDITRLVKSIVGCFLSTEVETPFAANIMSFSLPSPRLEVALKVC